MTRKRSRQFDGPELITLVVSIAVVLALIGGVAFVQLTGGDRPPRITATASVEEVRAEGGVFYLPVTIENTGDQAAEAILVVVVQGDREHELLIDYLAGHATAEGTAVLAQDPRGGAVTVEVRSFLSAD